MKLKLILLLILHICLHNIANSQVTIGSPEKPLYGILLDIKSKPDGTTDKGLQLPRVMLQEEKSLFPILTKAGAQNADSITLHRGLTVYNLTTNAYFCPGIYTWDGTSWKDIDVLNPSVYKGDNESNSFIVPTHGVIDIPVKKAFRFWKEYKTPEVAVEKFPNIDLSTLTPGHMQAFLLWQDTPGLVSNASSIDNSLFLPSTSGSSPAPAIIGSGEDANIRVIPKINRCDSIGGNAIVALAIDGTIYWSWHIWFTDYAPNQQSDAVNIGEYTVPKGKIYRYNNGFMNGDYIFMDRNLGALSATPGDTLTIGLYYQWGRKDPFPGLGSFFVSNQPVKRRPIYDAKNKNTQLPFKAIDWQDVPVTLNLPNAIQNPMVIYTNTSISDWYTNFRYTNSASPYQYLIYQNEFLWDENGEKTIFDPCPKGWRVPAFRNGLSPWVSPSAQIKGNNAQTNPLNYGGQWNQGWIFETTDYNIGYYPLTGILANNLNYQISSYTTGFYQTATILQYQYYNSVYFTFHSSSIQVYAFGRRSDAFPVRCVKE